MLGWRLCFVTDRTQCGDRWLEEVVAAACAEGLRCVQLREKNLTTRELFDYGASLREITRQHQASLLVNGRPDVALAVGADGLHAPEADAGALIELGRRLLDGILGVSSHSLAGAIGAADAHADYIFFGPVFDTPSKRPYGPPQGIDVLRRVAAAVDVPVIAVGGITPERAERCVEAGAAGVAAISAVAAARNLAVTMQEFREALGEL